MAVRVPTANAKAAAPKSKVLSLRCGDQVGRYVVLEQVGVGGFGAVYSAYDPELDRKIALKIMKTRHSRLGSARAQLSREAQALAKLSHENVVTVFDFGDWESSVFLAIEFVDGQTLKHWFLEQSRHWTEVVDVMLAAGRGLAAAHSAGIIHSDFKPQNVLMDKRGGIRVADFGLAKAMQDIAPIETENDGDPLRTEIIRRRNATIPKVAGHTQAPEGGNLVAGSPAYMAPEQFRGEEVNERSDQFSFCIVLFEGLYGRRPFTQTTVVELRAAVVSGEIEYPDEHSDVPRWIRDIVLRGLSNDPNERFESMDELLAALTLDPRAKARRFRRSAATVLITAAISVGGVLALTREPSEQEKATIENIADQAKSAAAKNYFVMPPVDQPEYPTALRRILELESLNGNYDPAADQKAAALREEFGQTLSRIGDYYWKAEYGKPFAIDYYTHAYVIDPNNKHARERSEMSQGQIAALTKKAKRSGFTRGELIAAEPLSALANAQVSKRAVALKQLQKKRRTRSYRAQEQLDLITHVTDSLAAKEVKKPAAAKEAAKSPKMVEKVTVPASKPSAFVVPLPEEGSPELALILGRPRNVLQKDLHEAGEHGPGKGNSRSAERKDRTSPTHAAAVGVAARAVSEGRTLLGRAKFKEAAQSFHRAIRANRRNSAAFMGLSDAYFEMGQYPKAVEYGERAVKLSPRLASYRWKLGDAYRRVSRYNDAREQYEAGVRLGNKKAKRRLGSLKKMLGE